MMTNLFSSFDPSTHYYMSMNWTSSLIFFTALPISFWMLKSRMTIIVSTMIKMINKEFKMLNQSNSSSTLIFISLLMFILMNNIAGLFPYIFTSTSHICTTLAMALPLWLALNLYGWFYKTNHMFKHLVPMGTPGILMPFMVCIETISNIIRPGTLAIRLSANMIAGHLLLTLMGNTGNYLFNIMLISMLTIQMLLLLLEIAVSMIQAYVFSILTTLYSNEIN
uniref:ATP synthase F0 subunit 6 n=1 Tax=Paragavialidium hainanense TaxID=3024219 RepID=UPI0023AAA8C2|nr:ATP synthase F0 subunit 6 [Paragavialidium hainanense]WCF77141.1 ATP synthase F0 subunit 6 [Paragavialidium hainanense]